jgi:Fas apoptotic inhibitory molecule (FAIM1)
MTKKCWTIQMEDGFHTVELEHHVWKRVIRVDGEIVAQGQKVFEFGTQYPLHVGGQPAAVLIGYNGFTYSYDLVVDGRSLKTGRTLAMKGGKYSTPMPSWTWGFVGACVLIPLMSMGGALPVLIGGGGAAACAAIARQEERATGTRVASCVGVTLLCWVLFGAMLVGMAALRMGR